MRLIKAIEKKTTPTLLSTFKIEDRNYPEWQCPVFQPVIMSLYNKMCEINILFGSFTSLFCKNPLFLSLSL